ncbi:MAG: response regulator transcription factor [Bacteroidetes bacterium]|nr:response regulator transcription factor [Bacteroidota bacterium]
MEEMNKLKILLAEDDRNLGNILRAYLEAKGFETRLFINGQEAFDAFQKEKFDFCILDVMMPIKDGFTLAREIRVFDKKTPILFLTAKSLQEDKLKGFEIGGDDYLTKPFSMEELLVRINAIIRRAQQNEAPPAVANMYRIGRYTFNYNRHILTFDSIEHKLTAKESELLKMLAENLNNVLDRSVALKHIWSDDSYFNARSMDVYIAKLRKYLKEDETVELINVHGIGFKLVANI